MGASRLRELLHSEPYGHALGALTGNQAMQMVRAGLKAIYLSGWQVAADNNAAGAMYPDQSLYPANSVPNLVTFGRQGLFTYSNVDDAIWMGFEVAKSIAYRKRMPLPLRELLPTYVDF